MRKCPACGSDNEDGSRFCKSCGRPLPDIAMVKVLRCIGCGAENEKTSRFCKSCGHPLHSPREAGPSTCRACGRAIAPDGLFCAGCGAPVEPEGTARQAPPVGNASRVAGLSEDEARRLFVGKKADHYLPKWKSMDTAKNPRSWNWAAAFFSGIWLAYRKMPLLAAPVLLINLASATATLTRRSDTWFGRVLPLIVAVTVGVAGNGWYYGKAKKKLALAKRNHADRESLKRAIVKTGGTSRAGAVISALVLVAWGVILVASRAGSSASTQRAVEAGQKLTFKAGNLFYVAPVGEEEARDLGNYLVQAGFFTAQPATVQVAKKGETWEFRMVVKEDFDKLEGFLDAGKKMALELSRNVFDDAPVEIQFCDKSLKIVGALAFPDPMEGWVGFLGTELTFSKAKLYYVVPVTEAEAKKLGDYLVANSRFGNTPATVQLRKSGSTYIYRFPVQAGHDQDEDHIRVVKQFGMELSQQVFDGAVVDVDLCDETMRTLRVVRASD